MNSNVVAWAGIVTTLLIAVAGGIIKLLHLIYGMRTDIAVHSARTNEEIDALEKAQGDHETRIRDHGERIIALEAVAHPVRKNPHMVAPQGAGGN